MHLPPADCSTCDYPGLEPANLDAWELFCLSQDIIMDGMGGVNLANVKIVAQSLNLTWSDDLVRKLLAVLKAVRGADGE